MQEAKGLLQLLLPLLLLATLVLFQIYFKAAGRGRAADPAAVPPEAPRPERESDRSPGEEILEPRRLPGAARTRRRGGNEPEASAAGCAEASPGSRIHLRRLLAAPRGRRTAVLVHEIFRQPPGLGGSGPDLPRAHQADGDPGSRSR